MSSIIKPDELKQTRAEDKKYNILAGVFILTGLIVLAAIGWEVMK